MVVSLTSEAHRRVPVDPGDEPAAGPDALVERIRRGDAAAFDHVYRACAPAAYRLAYAMLRSRPDAEEVVHDVFFSLWRRREELVVHGRLDLYVLVAARNRARNIMRQLRLAGRTREAHADDPVPLAMSTTPPAADDLLHARDLYRAIDQTVAHLPPRRRAAFLLRWKERLAYADIARVMGISVEAAQMHVARARDAIRQVIERVS
jgi:RNA polymerase sigma-70 factor (ECF subfamily)